MVRAGERDEQSVGDLGAEDDGDASAVGGEHVVAGVRESADQAVEMQPPKGIGHRPGV
jgi:hypothetical protein